MRDFSVLHIAVISTIAFTQIAAAADMPLNVPVQDTKQFGIATVTVGSGVAMLKLPSVGSMVTRGPNNSATDFPVTENFNFSNNFSSNVGWNVNGSIAIPMGGTNVSLNGFWDQVKGNSSFTCTPESGDVCVIVPLFDKPSTNPPVNGVINSGPNGGRLVGNSERKVDHWGVALESKWELNKRSTGTAAQSNAYYVALGADTRGIYQNLNSVISSTGPTLLFTDRYGENLDTTYYGAYLALGGTHAPPEWQALGLKAAFRLQAGVYYARTTYGGLLSNTGGIIGGGGDPSSALTLSRNDATFVGGGSLEFSKKIQKRATLSLKGDYEYYSYVPQMIYNTAVRNNNNPFDGTGRQVGTFIQNGNGSALRASIRLTVGLGPDELYR